MLYSLGRQVRYILLCNPVQDLSSLFAGVGGSLTTSCAQLTSPLLWSWLVVPHVTGKIPFRFKCILFKCVCCSSASNSLSLQPKHRHHKNLHVYSFKLQSTTSSTQSSPSSPVPWQVVRHEVPLGCWHQTRGPSHQVQQLHIWGHSHPSLTNRLELSVKPSTLCVCVVYSFQEICSLYPIRFICCLSTFVSV